jgi:hypothetical protein
VASTQYGEMCPKSCTPKAHFRSNSKGALRDTEETLDSIEQATCKHTAAASLESLQAPGINLILKPFWSNLPHANIHESITPDILHQLCQGLVKHQILWLKKILGAQELDARFKHLSPTHGVHISYDGIMGLTHVSDSEHKQIFKPLLGCLLGAVPEGMV